MRNGKFLLMCAPVVISGLFSRFLPVSFTYAFQQTEPGICSIRRSVAKSWVCLSSDCSYNYRWRAAVYYPILLLPWIHRFPGNTCTFYVFICSAIEHECINHFHCTGIIFQILPCMGSLFTFLWVFLEQDSSGFFYRGRAVLCIIIL